jgi:gluconolactonase
VRMARVILALSLATFVSACGSPDPVQGTIEAVPAATIGHVEAVTAGFNDIVDADALVEILSDGYSWTEGPAWVADGQYLLWSDTNTNIVYRWKEGEGASAWMTPSGYTGDVPRGGGLGSNGLALDAGGRLVLCQQGDRKIGRLISTLDNPQPVFETLASSYNGRRFHSPNDLAIAADGAVYFTDPPYGLADPGAAEQTFNGVYRAGPAGEVTLLDSTLTRPNGIAFSPDGQTLYVANSDPAHAVWMAYDVMPDGGVSQGRVFADVTAHVAEDNPGLPDGLKLDVDGRLFATGPGGVWVFESDGTHLGTIRTDVQTSNVAFGDDGSTLYLTSHMYLARVRTKTRGFGV